ncbi:MAG: ABC transporter substrate-binding protein [Bifidobacteriaceae bacterium]|jgi:peptide/nickel transport system substrate-binding protein|nr:ABC transporter substrate-binding protein [Bifidobacteriaceae bacterium]
MAIRKKTAALGGFTVLTLILASCATSGGGSKDSGKSGDVKTEITARYSAAPSTFNPSQLNGLDDYSTARLLYETLLRYNTEGEIVGALATEWETTATGGTFTISKDGVCGDGTAITPSIVADSLSYLSDPANLSTQKALVFGAGDVTVTADDAAGTVTITLSEPFSGLQAGLTTPSAGIICPAGLENPDSLKSDPDPGAFSGAYSLVSAKPGVEYQYKLRKEYVWPQWQKDLEGEPAQTLTFTVGVDPTAAENEIKSGSLDVGMVSLANLDSFENRAEIEIGEAFILFNESAGSPFQDIEKRRAVAGLVSGEEFSEVTYAGHAQVNYTAGSPKLQCANTDPELLVPFDPQAVIDSGVLKDVEITYSSSNLFGPNGAGSEYVFQQLEKAGAKVTYNLHDNNAWVADVMGPDPTTWDVTIFITVNNAISLWNPLSLMLGTPIEAGGRNMVRSDNPAGNELAGLALSANSDEEMCDQYLKLQQNLLERIDFVPLSSATVFYGLTEKIRYTGAAKHDDMTTLRIVN